VLVSHSDVIKAVLAYYLGVALDGISRFEVSPASVSTVAIGSWGATVHALNEVVAA
jgi:probable phosphoglycerate mutase